MREVVPLSVHLLWYNLESRLSTYCGLLGSVSVPLGPVRGVELVEFYSTLYFSLLENNSMVQNSVKQYVIIYYPFVFKPFIIPTVSRPNLVNYTIL